MSASPATDALEIAKAAYRAAFATLDDLRSAKAKEGRERLAVFTRDLNAELSARFDAPTAEAEAKFREAQQALDLAKEAEALATPREIPIGTEYQEWVPERRYSEKKKLSGRKAILEVITTTSVHPANLHDYSRASVGEEVLRILKKDGKPSALYLQKSKQWNWKPVDPELAQKAAAS